jgi:transcription-repair coupling factor (superfamily II helicase)
LTVPAFVVDPPVLHVVAQELADSERLNAFADELEAVHQGLAVEAADRRGPRARVSEPALSVLLAALHLRLDRGLVVVLPEDADARDAAEGASWFLGDETVALLPSRGVSWASGLEPAPHLVGERARALDVLAARGLVAASATAIAEGVPPPDERPEPIRLPEDADELTERLALAGYERAERAEERGQFAVRGGIVDVFPTTGREPLRVELFGDEIESMRAYSPFTQRTLHPVETAVIYPAAERRADLAAPTLRDDDAPAQIPEDLVPPLNGPPDLVWQPEQVRELWAEEGLPPQPLDGAAELDPFPTGQPVSFEAQRPAIAARGLAEAEQELGALVRAGLRVVVAFAHRGEALRNQNMLRRVDARVFEPGDGLTTDAELLYVVSPARRGFVWRDLRIAVLPDTQVFRRRPRRAEHRVGRALQSFADLRTGDHVVHEDHGVGKLLGFETKEVAGVTRDYLLLAFRGDDRLYVPHEQIGKVSRYVGMNGAPALSKLGGKAWQLLKSRAREGIRELAGELLRLYAQRQQAPGVAYDLRHEYLDQLEASFPYQETDDQRTAIEAVKEDLEQPRPMDRLVCGDVGFGKTEVAVRAAFAVALNGKQTLMLVPTTVLAQQHWNTFRERYRDFPLRVEMVSRFRSAKDTRQVLADYAEGRVDVLIGTHRVLSRDVIPKDLGLVIVDEEQRFGVAQKELLRQLRLEVDVLALTATPIPRTLHMSLSGLRDISIIETPPEGRRPIRTHVGEFDEELVKQALAREAARGGQAFYLHNRVETIDERAAFLQDLAPNLRFLVAHGQMREKELEDRMLSFLRGDADVLVSTTIIESGLDIPQANTLIVDRADALGLAQLYQIRGRVGRSDLLAHAYLFYPDASELTPEARARLATLADHTELGAGFAIAMRDLEIRGAGDLLGAEQSGHVAALGFELYVELLGEAVAELSGERRPTARPVRVDARVDAYIPNTYVDSEALRIDLHRRLALAETEDELRELEAATVDRFGPLPAPVENLLAIQEARIKVARLGADYLVFRSGRATVGPLVLGSGELRELRQKVDTAIYATARKEVSLRDDVFTGAIRLVDAILDSRRAA